MENSLEYIFGRLSKEEMIEHIESHPNQFIELIQVAATNNPPRSSRAAWLLSKVVVEQDSRIKNQVSSIINILPKVRDGQKRDLINVLRKLNLNEEQEGILFDQCIEIWCKIGLIPSVRITAFKYVLQVVRKYPELYGEIILLTEDFYVDPLSQGIKRSLQKLVKNLKKELG